MMLTLQAMRKLAYGQCITLKSAPKISVLENTLPNANTPCPLLKSPTITNRDEAETKKQHAHYKNEQRPPEGERL